MVFQRLQFIILLSLCVSMVYGQTGNAPNEKWYKFLRGDKRNLIEDLIPAQDGGYFVIGSSGSTKDDFKFCTSCSYGSDQAYIVKL